MTQEVYEKLRDESGAIELARPFWNAEDYHDQIWKDKDITVLICQRKTKIATAMCVESLLRFYPNIQILVVDGNSEDDSTLYLRYMALKHPNITVWERNGRNSHGETIDEAINQYIETEYVLLMDSDVITMKHGMIEGMFQQFTDNPKMYATGTLMLVSRENQSCGAPHDEYDVLRYAHPCLSMYHVPTYKTLSPAADHGACLWKNMQDAESNGYYIGAFDIYNYSIHISGTSWQEIGSVYDHDNDVFTRPFVTFIATKDEHLTQLKNQTDHDFEVMPLGNGVDKMISLHGIQEPHQKVQNRLFDIRFQVHGEYVCYIPESQYALLEDFVHQIKLAAIESRAAKEFEVDGIKITERKHWQRNDALK